MLIVSACLAGVNCRYDGGHCTDPRIAELVEKGMALPVCPEQLGGLPTPRPAAEICGGTGGDVLDGRAGVMVKNGGDVTEEFIRGAEEVLRLARTVRAKEAILKAGSPSCGCGWIYDGSFKGVRVHGNGVTAECLLRHNFKVRTEEGR